jgi:hypothetical protein
MEFVNGKDDIPYMKWKKKFENTNQYYDLVRDQYLLLSKGSNYFLS